MGLLLAAGQAGPAEEAEKKYFALEPVNLPALEFPVPWGLRYGRPARVFFIFTIGEGGAPKNIKTIKSIPHNDYQGIAKATLKKFRYPAEDEGKPGFRELHYCVLTDHQSTFACTIRFDRVNGNPALKAEAPGDQGFFEIDKYGGSPRVRINTLPAYPWMAAQKNQCGWVKVAFEVSKAGIPRKVKVLEGSAGGMFSLAAKEAIQEFTFTKGEAPVQIVYLVSFEIPGKCKP